jgi:NCS1 family nucleobase:cation symporter-1
VLPLPLDSLLASAAVRLTELLGNLSVVGVWAFAPWKVLNSAGNFISFMSSYSCVLAPMGAILAADYWIVKRQRMSVPALYDPQSIYRYGKWGINWRALVALVVSIAPNLPGMAHALNSSINIGGAKYIYCVADIFGMVVAASTLAFLSKLFPDHTSLISEPILADDVWAGKVPGYEHMEEKSRIEQRLSNDSEDKLDAFEPRVVAV